MDVLKTHTNGASCIPSRLDARCRGCACRQGPGAGCAWHRAPLSPCTAACDASAAGEHTRGTLCYVSRSGSPPEYDRTICSIQVNPRRLRPLVRSTYPRGDALEELTPLTHLHDEIEASAVLKEVDELHYAGMVPATKRNSRRKADQSPSVSQSASLEGFANRHASPIIFRVS